MEWYWIVVLTIIGYNAIGAVLGILNKEELCMYWAGGIVYFTLWFLYYPIRATKTYDLSCIYYQKQGVSKLQYLFGKRVRDK